MTITPQEIITSQFLTTGQATYYTVPARIPKVQVTKCNFNNVSAVDVLVSAWIVKAGDTPNDENNILKNKNIVAGQNYSSGEARKLMYTGDYIVAVAGANSSINISANGNAIR